MFYLKIVVCGSCQEIHNLMELTDILYVLLHFTGAVLVSVNFSMTFTLVSPEDNVYVEDCLATKPLNCSGLYHFQKTRLPVLQSLIEKLKTNPSCSGLEPVDFDPCYTEPPTTSSASTLGKIIAASALDGSYNS